MSSPRCSRCGREASDEVLICGGHGVCFDCEDNEGLPPGFDPVWTFIKTEDGVVEYEHPAANALHPLVTCTQCAGQGWVLLRRSGSITRDCPTCEGTGRVPDEGTDE